MVWRSMTERALPRLACLGVALAALLLGTAQAAPVKTTTIGYLELTGDERYEERDGPAETRITPGRPIALAKAEGESPGDLVARIDALAKEGVHWFLIDAPDAAVAEVAQATRERGILLLNISARGDDLRGARCQKHLLNVVPSRAMLADALAQLLVARKWPEVLILEGPLPEDQAMTAAFEHAAKRFGLRVTAKRPFLVSNDPREREKDNVALLTGGASYDIVFVADADGQFARELPYRTVRPRPVLGATGLVAAGWHWAWERYGAPQLSHRFAHAAGRQMEAADWSAWIAVRAIADAVERSGASEASAVDAYLLGPDLSLDGDKGPPLSFRSWDHQLRQPILLATADAVIATAPLPGFLHATNVLDTLGYDQPETACHF